MRRPRAGCDEEEVMSDEVAERDEELGGAGQFGAEAVVDLTKDGDDADEEERGDGDGDDGDRGGVHHR
jgi:hypothetical protein